VGPRTARSGRSAEMHIQAPAGAFLHAAKRELDAQALQEVKRLFALKRFAGERGQLGIRERVSAQQHQARHHVGAAADHGVLVPLRTPGAGRALAHAPDQHAVLAGPVALRVVAMASSQDQPARCSAWRSWAMRRAFRWSGSNSPNGLQAVR